MEKTTLQEQLKKLEDKRRGQGRRHSIDLVLMLAIMATMSGFFGYRAIGDFALRYKDELIEYLKQSKDRLPVYATVRRALKDIDSNCEDASLICAGCAPTNFSKYPIHIRAIF